MPSGQQQILFQRHFDGHHIETAQKIVELWQSQLTREESGWIINWPLTFKLPHLGQRGRLLKFLWKLKDYSKREIVFWAQLLRSGAPDCHWIGLAAQWAVPPDGDWLCPPSVHSGDGCPWEEVAVKLSEVGIDALARQGGRHRAWWWRRRFWCTLKTVWRWSLSLVVSSSCEVSFCCNAMWCWWTRMSCDVMLAFAGMLCNVMLMNVLNGYEWYAMEVYLLCSEWSFLAYECSFVAFWIQVCKHIEDSAASSQKTPHIISHAHLFSLNTSNMLVFLGFLKPVLGWLKYALFSWYF